MEHPLCFDVEDIKTDNLKHSYCDWIQYTVMTSVVMCTCNSEYYLKQITEQN